MKALETLIIILFFCNGFSSLAAQERNVENGVIELDTYPIKTKDRTGSTSEEGLPIKRSIQRHIADAYIYNNVVSIHFNVAIAAATISITNESTGETVYLETCSNPAMLSIDLNGESNGNYLIEIETDETCLQGNFTL